MDKDKDKEEGEDEVIVAGVVWKTKTGQGRQTGSALSLLGTRGKHRKLDRTQSPVSDKYLSFTNPIDQNHQPNFTKSKSPIQFHQAH